MESKLNRQKNVTNTLSKPKQYSEPKKNTWGNLLQRKPVCTSTKTTSDIKKQSKIFLTENFYETTVFGITCLFIFFILTLISSRK